MLTLSSLVASILPQVTPSLLSEVPAPAFAPRLEFTDLALSVEANVWLQSAGRHVLVQGSEPETGADLNGDGDTLDQVLHGLDLLTGAVTNFGLAGDGRMDPRAPGRAILRVAEADQWGQDLNGDGDASDRVFFALDLRGGEVRNSGLAGSQLLMDGPRAALGVSELAQGSVDLNGDGRISGALFAWDLDAPGAPVNVGSPAFRTLEASHQTFFLFTVDETRDGVDRNGDGDALDDSVLHAYDARTGSVVGTGLDGSAHASGLHSALIVGESAQGADLNGDGDELDHVLHVFDLATGQLGNTGLAVGFPEHASYFEARVLELEDGVVAFHVSEPDQGGTDLNGDGDALDRDVLFLHFIASGATRNLGLSVFNFELEGGLLAMQVGTPLDTVCHVHEVAANATWDLDVRTPVHFTEPSTFAIRGDWVAVVASESGTDHTRDGDAGDRYLVLADVRNRRILHTDLALRSELDLSRILAFHDSGLLTVLADEREMSRDLDGDAAQHTVLQLVFPRQGLLLSSGTGGHALAQGHRTVFPFLAKEAGIDRNGDGDTQDTVVRTVRVRWR
jgi:hypothetical protein